MDSTKEIKYLDEGSGKAIVNEINKLRKKVDNIEGEGSGGGYTPNEWFGTKDEFEMLDSKEEGKWYYIYED